MHSNAKTQVHANFSIQDSLQKKSMGKTFMGHLSQAITLEMSTFSCMQI